MKDEDLHNLRLNGFIEAETYSGGKKFSRVWFRGTGSARTNVISKIITLDPSKMYYCQRETLYLKVSFDSHCHNKALNYEKYFMKFSQYYRKILGTFSRPSSSV